MVVMEMMEMNRCQQAPGCLLDLRRLLVLNLALTPLQDPVVLARHVSLFQIGFISAIDQTFSLNDIAVG